VRFAFSPKPKTDSRPPSILRNLLDGILAVAFPTECSLCQGELTSDARGRICRACWTSLQPWAGPVCTCCGLPFSSPRALDAAEPKCGECRSDDPAFDGARSFGLYTGNLRKAVLRVKFSGDERLGRHLGELLASTWDTLPQAREFNSALIVPVPLHPSRRRERGFNQSELLAAGLVRALAKRNAGSAPKIIKSCLCRKRATTPQTGLSVSARRQNLRGAFEAPKPEEVRGRVIVLVDDVMTTGATLSACARTLKRAGAAKVMGLTLVRATPQFPDFTRDESDNTVDEIGRNST
jgi:competence protein ComFC